MKQRMKQSVAILLLIFTVLTCVAACGDKGDTPTHVDYAVKNTFDPASTDTVKAEVTVKSFIDGDTTHFFVPTSISETGVLKARYLGINTPESTGQIEAYGKKAASFTKEKLENATSIYIESDNGQWNLDSTGARHLVWVWYKPAGSDTYRNLNIEIMQNGLAIQSNSADNRYGEACVAAYNQAVSEKLHVHSGQKDPDFYYGDAIVLTLNELRCNIADYVGKTVTFEAIVTKNSGADGVYVEAYDEETKMYNGIYVYYGANARAEIREILAIGTRVRMAGKVSEFAGSYQLSDLSFSPYRPTAKDIEKLDDEVHSASYTLTDPQLFREGRVTIVFETEDEVGENEFDYAALALHSSIAFKNLRVVSTYTTNNPASSSNGAITIYCKALGSDGREYDITVRTGVLYNESGTRITADLFADKTIDVKGIVDFYDPDSGESENGDFHYQIKVLSWGDIIIQNP